MAETVRTTTAIDEVLHGAVARGDVPGVVAMAAGDDGVLYEGAAGVREAGTDDPITPDTMMRIASMTKMVTTVAALQLVERGELDLDEAVAKYRPEFAELQILEGFDGDTPRLRPPASQATVRQLATHTSGLGYWFWNADIDRYEQLTGVPNVLPGSVEVFKSPLVGDRGTIYEYGINTDWLGRVVEAVSGQSLADYVDEHITGPLGMTSTTRRMTDEQRANSTPIHVRGEDGSWTPTDIDWAQEPEFWGGGHYLYSTPRDYLRFQRMLLGRGTFEGTEILEPETVDDASRNQRIPGCSVSLTRRPRPNLSPGPRFRSALSSGWAVGCAAGKLRSPMGAVQRRLGGPVQHALLGGPQVAGDGLDLLSGPAVRRSAGPADVRRLRARAVRVALRGAACRRP